MLKNHITFCKLFVLREVTWPVESTKYRDEYNLGTNNQDGTKKKKHYNMSYGRKKWWRH